MTTDSDSPEPLLTNDRARREWAWLVQHVGEQAARAAIARIPGNRRPYPLNIAKVLGLAIPQELAEEPKRRTPEVAQQHLAELRKRFKLK